MFDQLFGFDVPTPIEFVLYFAAFILLILLSTVLIRRFGGKRLGGMAASGRSRQPRLGVLDVLPLDGRRRLVIVRRDNVEHLVMIGGPNDVVVESGILRSPAGAQREPSVEAPPTRTAPPQPVLPQPPVAARAAPVVTAVERPQPTRAPEPARPAEPVRAAEPVAAAPRVEAPVAQPQRAPVPVAKPTSAPAPVAQPAARAPEAPKPAAVPEPVKPQPVKPEAIQPEPVKPAAPAPAPVRPASPPIVAGPAARENRSNELAERLAAALKRPVTPAAATSPEPVKPPVEDGSREARVAARIAARNKDSQEQAAPEPRIDQPKKDAAPEVKLAPAQPLKAEAANPFPASMGQSPQPAPTAPAVRPAAPPAPPAPANKDEDPLAALEAEMASLLGRDLGAKPKS